MAIPIPGAARTSACIAALFALAACETGQTTATRDGLRIGFTPPQASTAVPITTRTADGSFLTGSEVSRRLNASGYAISSVRENSVVARSSNNATVDCGTLEQTLDGETTLIDGNAARSVLFHFDSPGDIIQRVVSVETDVTAQRQDAASFVLTPEHTVTVSYRTALGEVISNERRTFSGAMTEAFANGTTCVTAPIGTL